MKTIIIICFFCLTLIQNTFAKIWRINNQSDYNGTTIWGGNFGGTPSFPVFKQINQAVGFGPVSAGDTLYVEGSQTVYDDAVLTKKLFIIGAGYLLHENPLSSHNLYSTTIKIITLNAGSAGSELTGLAFSSAINVSIDINVSNVTIKRCLIDKRIDLADAISNIKILQNYFSNYVNGTAVFWDALGTPPNDIIFNNNISRRSLITTGFSLLECKNNIFDPPNPTGSNVSIDISVGNFQNNILKNPSAIVNINNGTNQNVSYNIAAATQFGTVNNNLMIADMATLFVNGTNLSTDGAYQLQQPQPAAQLGSDGADRGAFGGIIVSNRYTLSGLAPIPVTYEVNTSGVGTNASGLNVELKARTIQ